MATGLSQQPGMYNPTNMEMMGGGGQYGAPGASYSGSGDMQYNAAAASNIASTGIPSTSNY